MRIVGFFRKVTSVSTMGAVDFLSDKERAARSARLNKRAMKKNNKLLKEQNELLREQNRLAGH